MKQFLQRGLRVVAGLVLSVSAAVTVAPNAAPAAGAVLDAAAVTQARASVQALVSASRAAAVTRGVRGGDRPSDIVANPYRAYPGSCLNEGLGNYAFRQSPSDPAPYQTQFTLQGDPLAGGTEASYSETVTITVWRVPCSKASNGSGQSAVLLAIDRTCGACNSTSLYPVFPGVVVTQGTTSLYVRLAEDQNTWFDTTYPFDPVYSSSTWVLENYYGSVQFDFNQAFAIAFNNSVQFNVSSYNPAQYAATSQSLPITGHMTSNWYDPAHGGEGMLTQIFDNNDGQTRTFTAAWYTFGTDGLPFWLYAQGSFNIGATTTGSVDTYYPTGGSFAGTGGSASFTKWGTITFSFPDCGHMSFAYNGTSGANAPVGPSGASQRTWIRIANVNSIVCD